MTGAFTTEQEAMQRGANAVQEAHQQVQGLIQTLSGEVEQMMGGWGGQAASAFMGVHEAFNGQAAKINQALDRMHQALVCNALDVRHAGNRSVADVHQHDRQHQRLIRRTRLHRKVLNRHGRDQSSV